MLAKDEVSQRLECKYAIRTDSDITHLNTLEYYHYIVENTSSIKKSKNSKILALFPHPPPPNLQKFISEILFTYFEYYKNWHGISISQDKHIWFFMLNLPLNLSLHYKVDAYKRWGKNRAQFFFEKKEFKKNNVNWINVRFCLKFLENWACMSSSLIRAAILQKKTCLREKKSRSGFEVSHVRKKRDLQSLKQNVTKKTWFELKLVNFFTDCCGRLPSENVGIWKKKLWYIIIYKQTVLEEKSKKYINYTFITAEIIIADSNDFSEKKQKYIKTNCLRMNCFDFVKNSRVVYLCRKKGQKKERTTS